jgi:hypothetical protein
MNYLLIIIYIIGTHSCFRKNAKTQKRKKVYSARARHPPPPYKKQTPWHGRKIFLAMQKTGR